jgi:hypothetical protein
VKFTSTTYGYTVTPPAGWVTVQAQGKWDGHAGLVISSPVVDEFLSTDTRDAWAVARPWRRDLAAYTRFLIAWNAQYHGQLCPAKPDVTTTVTIGGQPGVLLGYACGILINIAATVHRGVAYEFVLKDDHVQAATSPADHATFAQMLNTVQFPN